VNEPDTYEDGLDFDPDDWDDPAEDPFPEDRYEQHLIDQADAEYEALPWWRRRIEDWRRACSRRRAWRQVRRNARRGLCDTKPPF
jgi:hypothetical protein